jgi:hypothetical protein
LTSCIREPRERLSPDRRVCGMVRPRPRRRDRPPRLRPGTGDRLFSRAEPTSRWERAY